jgi:hypothetical protein
VSGATDKTDFLSDLEKWQASNAPELASTKPEEIFEADFVKRYYRLHQDVWRRMIRLHGTLLTVEQLKEFPLEYLYPAEGMEFWRLVIENFLDTAVVMLHALVNDTGKDALSLPSFRNEIIQARWLSEEKRDLFKDTMRERKFDGFVISISDRVEAIRHNRVAHRLVDKQSGNPKQALAVTLEELRRLFSAAHLTFGGLSFGSTYATLAGDLMPTTIGGQPMPTCLEEVLSAVLRTSPFVNQPELRAEWWPQDRKFMSAERLRVMNELRRRIGLPEP